MKQRRSRPGIFFFSLASFLEGMMEISEMAGLLASLPSRIFIQWILE